MKKLLRWFRYGNDCEHCPYGWCERTSYEYDEWDAKSEEIESTLMKRFKEIRRTEFALCYPEPRNEWFANFVSSFADGCTQISEKQYRVFERYCEENPESWRTYESYCRMGDRLITLKWKNSNRSVTIERFNTNVKELLA